MTDNAKRANLPGVLASNEPNPHVELGRFADRLRALMLMRDADHQGDPDLSTLHPDYSDEFLEYAYGPVLDALLNDPKLLRRLMKERKNDA